MKKLILRDSEWIAFFIVLLSFVVASYFFYFYPGLPVKFASHWNAVGQVNGYISKFWGLFLQPLISAGLFLLFLVIPKIDPLKANIARFREYFDMFVLIILFFLFFLYALTIYWNLGHTFNMVGVLVPALAILFFYTGILIENAKRNWFIGIKTPWTLSSDVVWDKTHKLGGQLFKASGLITLLGIFFQSYAILFVILPAIFTAIYTVIYSYLEYQKINL
jgi:uncharacterized membrane protein